VASGDREREARVTRIIAIAGGSGSGKTTLVTALAAHFGREACVISHDRYYRPVSTDAAASTNFDEPSALDSALLAEHLSALRAGRAAFVPGYDFSAFQRMEGEWLEPAPLVLVEGILVLAAPELRPFVDGTLFVDTPEAERLARRIERDTVERGRTLRGVLSQYFGTVRPMYERWVAPERARADRVVDGTTPVDGLVAALAPWVAGRPDAT
jgi:uridine kinase